MSSTDLSAIRPQRPTYRIRTNDNPEGLRPDTGSEYEFRTPEEFGLLEIQQIQRDFSEVNRLWGELETPEEEDVIKALLDALVCRLIEGPEDQIRQLSPLDKRGVVLRFFTLSNARQLGALGPEVREQLVEMSRLRELAG